MWDFYVYLKSDVSPNAVMNQCMLQYVMAQNSIPQFVLKRKSPTSGGDEVGL